jgi:hypothetical protein
MITRSFPFMLLAAMALGTVGCTFIMRSPEDYRRDTRTLIETRQPAIKACYDSALKADPNAKGTVAIVFKVEKKTGTITDAQVAPERTTAPAALSACVVDSVRGLVLDPPDQKDGEGTFVFDFQGPAPAAG